MYSIEEPTKQEMLCSFINAVNRFAKRGQVSVAISNLKLRKMDPTLTSADLQMIDDAIQSLVASLL